MLFNYNSGIKELFNRQGSYLPGQMSKTTDLFFTESINSLDTNEPIEFGTVLKREIDVNTNIPYVCPIEEDDTYDKFYGIAIRDIISQYATNYGANQSNFITSYVNGYPISVLREGYITVPVQNGTPIPGQPVYVRVMTSTDNPNLPIGGIEATASTGTVEWKNVKFVSGPYFPAQGNSTTPTAQIPTSQCATIYVSITDYLITPIIDTAPTALPINYGTTLGDVTLQGGEASYNGENVPGTFVMNNPLTIPTVGTETYTATFIPNDLSIYDKVSNVEVVITVNKADPEIISEPTTSGSLYYGDALSSIQLVGGNANVEGVFSWNQESATPQSDGNQLVTFTPTDTNNYNIIDDIEVNVTVIKVPTKVSQQPTASSIASGSLLSTSVISGGLVVDARDGSTDVEGSWAWQNGGVAVDETGNYTAIFTPTNVDKYEEVTTEILVTIE